MYNIQYNNLGVRMMATEVRNYSEVRQNLKSIMDKVIEDRVPITIMRKRGEPVIMIAQSEYDALMETFHLMRSPINAQRLLESIAQIEAGTTVEIELTDESLQRRFGSQ